MPSEKRQLNVRLDEDLFLLLTQLHRRIREKLRLPDLSQADLIRMALTALEKEYPPDEPKGDRQ